MLNCIGIALGIMVFLKQVQTYLQTLHISHHINILTVSVSVIHSLTGIAGFIFFQLNIDILVSVYIIYLNLKLGGLTLLCLVLRVFLTTRFDLPVVESNRSVEMEVLHGA